MTNDYSNSSKAFSRSIFAIKHLFFPFILVKWVRTSWTMMALSAAYRFLRKLAWHGPVKYPIIPQSLLTMILVIILYEVLQRLIGLKFLREVAFLLLGIRHIWVELVASGIDSLMKDCLQKETTECRIVSQYF